MRTMSRLVAPILAHRGIAPQPQPGRAGSDAPPLCADGPPTCGWFDSSHDLQTGLRVTEHAQVDAVVNQIPLSWWLGWELDAALAPAR